MGAILSNFRTTFLVGLTLAVVMIGGFLMHSGKTLDINFLTALCRFIHVFFGILWIGLLYYFNFVQIRKMPDIPADLKPAISKYIAPEALFWFHWAAKFTVLSGLLIAYLRGYWLDALSLGQWGGYGSEKAPFVMIGVGMWLAIIMFLNVWVLIWPNQKIALGLTKKDYDPERKAAAARLAMMVSRINLILSLPMLVTMTLYQTLFG